ncbi:MAG: PilW family protein [Burkholderiales bacterium]|nr:PilW family protein [Burkholderiales bacterium]
MSLIEVMVGVLIGMIGIVVIFQVLQISEERKRTTGAGSDAQIAGSIGMYNLERDLRHGGYGFSTAAQMGCAVVAYDALRSTPNWSFTLAPIVIADGASGAPDTLTVLRGNSNVFVASQTFNMATGTSNYTQGRTGFRPGDRVVLANAVPACTLVEITGTANPDGASIDHATGGYTNYLGQGVTARYNDPGGAAIASGTGFLYNLGPGPQLNVWQIAGNRRLTVTNDMQWVGAAGTAVEVADGVIDLQAQYGVDANNDEMVGSGEWTNATPGNWANLLAVRVAILARSQQYERPLSTSPCSGVTQAATAWAGGSFVMRNVDGTADTTPCDANDWRNYRYRVYEVVIPFRNMIWGTE